MSKENVLYSIIGLLLGCIVGFIFANSVNQKGGSSRQPSGNANSAASRQNSNLPPDHPQIPSNEVADQSGMQEQVTAQIQQARNEPTNFEAQAKAADLFYQIRRFDEAIEFLLRANQVRPEDYTTIVKLGNANFETGNYETAEKWYAAALIRNPDDVNVRTDLGLTFYLRNPPDYERALTEYRESLRRDPRHEQTLQNMVVALTRVGNAAEAEEMLARLQQVNPANEALSKLRSDLDALKSQPGTQAAANGGKQTPAAKKRGRR
ncbi:MAG TPA: tetratricopeptide repeat protein [Pyrinomonadaceae bacterium]|jgi:tetratricopeptide (TPR) repeat protein|nr:tetratricopeptide repeat protein [Pyrinomonadaceae bacterium]